MLRKCVYIWTGLALSIALFAVAGVVWRIEAPNYYLWVGWQTSNHEEAETIRLADSLGQCGTVAIDPLLETVREREPYRPAVMENVCIRALRAIGPQAHSAILQAIKREQDFNIRLRYIHVLQKSFGDWRYVPELVQHMQRTRAGDTGWSNQTVGRVLMEGLAKSGMHLPGAISDYGADPYGPGPGFFRWYRLHSGPGLPFPALKNN